MFHFTYSYPPKEKVDQIEEKAHRRNAPCQKQMIAWIDCMKEARTSYVEEGKDVNASPEWSYYHLKKCLHPFIDARECQVEKKVKVVREMKKVLTDEQWEQFQKRQRFTAYKAGGANENWDKIWNNPDLDTTEYFKNYRVHMENILQLEEEYKHELATTGDIRDPEKYYRGPKKWWDENQVMYQKPN